MSEAEAKCKLCGEPMPPGEEMFFYHGYSGPCPKPPLPKESTDEPQEPDAITKLKEEIAHWKQRAETAELCLDAYKAHHASFHADCNLKGPQPLPKKEIPHSLNDLRRMMDD